LIDFLWKLKDYFRKLIDSPKKLIDSSSNKNSHEKGAVRNGSKIK